MADNLQKRPAKGILKNSSSFDKQETNAKKAKETKWDEMNIIATLHPADKDYGHMKIDEPKTPYSYGHGADELDASELAEKIKQSSKTPPKFLEEEESDEDDDADLTEEERQRRKEFKLKRKKHYNEYYAVQLARKLLEEEEEEDDEQTNAPSPSNSPPKSKPSPRSSPTPKVNTKMHPDKRT